MNNSPENITFYAGRELPDKNTLAGCTKFFYGISRDEIEACDTSRLLENFGPSIDPVSAKSLQGKVHFFVHGYDEVDVHIFRIPEIWKFYAEIHQQCPVWFYYCELESSSLLAIWGCFLNDRLDGGYNAEDERAGRYARHLVEFFNQCVPHFYGLCEKHHVPERVQTSHFNRVLKYFHVNPITSDTRKPITDFKPKVSASKSQRKWVKHRIRFNMTSIFDTNIWLLAAAKHLEESNRDKRGARYHRDVDQIRGAIFMALIEGDVIVPKAVVEELSDFQNFQKSEKLNAHSREIMERLLYIFRHHAMEIIPTREDLTRQSALLAALAFEPEKSQGFLTYSKLPKETIAKIQTAADAAKKSLAKVEPEGAWATLAREIEQLKAQRESTTDPKALNKKITGKRKRLAKTNPFVLPDYELLLCAERTGAQIFTLDSDLQAFWAISPSLRKIREPRVVSAVL